MASQQEIEDILIHAKYCQGLLKEFVPEFEYISYIRNEYSKGETKASHEIREVAERKNSSGNDAVDYQKLCNLIIASKAAHTLDWRSEVDLENIIDSLQEMREIARFYARNREYRLSKAEEAEHELSSLLDKCKRAKGVFGSSSYYGVIGVEAIAADIFKGSVKYRHKNNGEKKEEPKKIENKKRPEDNDPYAEVYRLLRKDPFQGFTLHLNKSKDPYEEVYRLLDRDPFGSWRNLFKRVLGIFTQ